MVVTPDELKKTIEEKHKEVVDKEATELEKKIDDMLRSQAEKIGESGDPFELRIPKSELGSDDARKKLYDRYSAQKYKIDLHDDYWTFKLE